MKRIKDYTQLHYELCMLAQSYTNDEISVWDKSPESLAKARAALCFDLIYKFFNDKNNCTYLSTESPHPQICDEGADICRDFKITNVEDFLHEMYNYSFPPDFQRSFPKYNPNNILVFAWSGALKVDIPNSVNLELGDLKWVNKSLKDKLFSIADTTLETKYRTFFEKREGISIENFFNTYLSHKFIENAENQQVEIVVYLELLKRIAKHFITNSYYVNELTPEKIETIKEEIRNSIKVEIENAGIKPTTIIEPIVKIINSESKNEENNILIIGGELSKLQGIKLFQKDNTAKEQSDRYDLFSVFILTPLNINDRISINHFLSIQGLIIPAERRSAILNELEEQFSLGKAIQLIARSFSHNIGSHAILHLINDLDNSTENFSNENLKTFFQYIQGRNTLIAEISSSSTYYTLDLPLLRVLKNISLNDLINTYLCKTEDLELDMPYSDHIENKIKESVQKYQIRENDLVCDIPLATTGIQAINAILENMARNYAKHSEHRREIGDSRTVRIILHDINIVIEEEKLIKLTFYDANALYEDVDKTCTELNRNLSKSKDYFRWNSTTDVSFLLGHAEMLVWCAFLRSIQFHKIPSLEFDVVQYVSITIDDQKYLGFYFFLLTSQKFISYNTLNTPLPRNLPGFIFYDIEDSMQIKSGQKINLYGNYLIKSGNKIYLPLNKQRNIMVNLDHHEKITKSNIDIIHLRFLKEFSFSDKKVGFIIIDELESKLNGREFELVMSEQSIIFHFLKESSEIPKIKKINEYDAIAIWCRHKTIDDPIVKKNLNSIYNKIFHFESIGSKSLNVSGIFIEDIKKWAPETMSTILDQDCDVFDLFIRLAETAFSKILIIDERGIVTDEKHIDELKQAGIFFINPGKIKYNILKNINSEPMASDSNLSRFVLQSAMPFSMISMHMSLKSLVERIGIYSEPWDKICETLYNITPYFYLHTGKGNVYDKTYACIGVSEIESFLRQSMSKSSLIRLIRRNSRHTVQF